MATTTLTEDGRKLQEDASQPAEAVEDTVESAVDTTAEPVIDAAQIEKEKAEAEAEAAAAKKAEEAAAIAALPAAERIGFTFATSGSTDYKGRFNIQPSGNFEMNSLYRKRDKGTMEGGVSLMVGIHEDSGHEEAVAAYFDRSKFTLDQAAEWWLTHQHRFNY